MSAYYIDISSQFDITQITQALQDEELLFAEFKCNKVLTAEDLTVVNHAKFEECDVQQEKPVAIIVKDNIAPSGKTKFWEGTMVVSGSIINVEAYR